MPDYVTDQQFCEHYGYFEIARTVQFRDLPNVQPELLRATVEGAPVSDWSAEEQAAALEALNRLDAARDTTQEEVDAGLRKAGLEVPLSAPDQLIQFITTRIMRYYLSRENPTDVVRQQYQDAHQALMDIASGKLAVDPDIDGNPQTGDQSNSGYHAVGKLDQDYDRSFTAAQLRSYTRTNLRGRR